MNSENVRQAAQQHQAAQQGWQHEKIKLKKSNILPYLSVKIDI